MLQSCLILCDPMDCSLPGSSDHGILQTRILGWVTLSSSKGSPRDRTCISCGSCIAGGFFTTWATREALKKQSIPFWLWQDSNLQSSDPKSDALSIRPRGPSRIRWKKNLQVLRIWAILVNCNSWKIPFPSILLKRWCHWYKTQVTSFKKLWLETRAKWKFCISPNSYP